MFDIFRIGKFKNRIAELESENGALSSRLLVVEKTAQEIGALDAAERRSRIAEISNELAGLEQKKIESQKDLASVEAEIFQKRSHLAVLDEDLLLETFGFYKLKLPLLKSEQFKNHLGVLREKQKDLIKDGRATKLLMKVAVEGDAKAGARLTRDIQKLLIRAFNNECDSCVENVKFNNIETFVARIEKSFDSLNKLGQVMYAQLTDEFKDLKIQELQCAYEYQVVKQREKDELRRQREIQRDAQKAEQEIRAARQALEKERKHFASAIAALDRRIETAEDDLARQELFAQKQSLYEKVTGLDTQEKELDYREQNAKAGFVYIVSNLGAFGENVYKIGMTRRLEPMERIDELGDASVPFEFDLHALVFSDDAPALEAKIHGHFEAHRVNKVNRRKEFFKAELAEIEKVVRANYDKMFELTYEATAEQYRESLRVSSSANAV